MHKALRNNALPTTTTNIYLVDEDEDSESGDDFTLRSKSSRKGQDSRNPANGVPKYRGLTHLKEGVTLNTKGRKKRKDYQSSWECSNSQMK